MIGPTGLSAPVAVPSEVGTEHLSENPALDALAVCTFGSALAAAQAGAPASR